MSLAKKLADDMSDWTSDELIEFLLTPADVAIEKKVVALSLIACHRAKDDPDLINKIRRVGLRINQRNEELR